MARPTLARRLGAATLLTTLVLTSAACGDDDATATDESSSSATSGSTDDAEQASGDLEELSVDEFYPTVMAAMQEAESMGFSITTTSGDVASEMTGVMEYGDQIAMQGSSTGASAMEMIMLDKILYLSGASLPLSDAKKWLKVDLTDPDSLFGQLGKSTDPSMMFKAMGAPKKFELVGSEEVDGVETNRYSVVMDGASYAKAMDLPAELVEFMPEEIGIEMWVDGDNRPRKFHSELEIPDATGSGKPTRTTTEGTYFDFGTDVDIEAPPAGEVTDSMAGMG